jgi:hypothetical protein
MTTICGNTSFSRGAFVYHSWLTNSASYMSPNAGGGGGAVLGLSANEFSRAHGAQINFGDQPPYLTCGKSFQALVNLLMNRCFTLTGRRSPELVVLYLHFFKKHIVNSALIILHLVIIRVFFLYRNLSIKQYLFRGHPRLILGIVLEFHS